MGFTENDSDDILDALKKWSPPPNGKDEAFYENEIYSFLHETFPKEIFHRQYTIGKSRSDIYVHFKNGAKVVLEVKKDLADRNDYHRLIGQVYEYLTECEVEVVLVLCGKNDHALLKLSREALENLEAWTRIKARFVNKPV